MQNETALLKLMAELRPILERRSSFAGFAVFDGEMWLENSAHAPAHPSSRPFIPAAVWGIGADNSIAVNRSLWPAWLSWAKTRRITAAYVAPHAGSPWLFPVPGAGGSDADAAAFCEFVGAADAAGIDLELYLDGWPGAGRPSWNKYSYEFVHNCTLQHDGMSKPLRPEGQDQATCPSCAGNAAAQKKLAAASQRWLAHSREFRCTNDAASTASECKLNATYLHAVESLGYAFYYSLPRAKMLRANRASSAPIMTAEQVAEAVEELALIGDAVLRLELSQHNISQAYRQHFEEYWPQDFRAVRGWGFATPEFYGPDYLEYRPYVKGSKGAFTSKDHNVPPFVSYAIRNA